MNRPSVRNSRFIPFPSPLVSDPSSASYHNQRYDRGPGGGLTWTRVLRGIGRALFRGSRSYSRQVSAAQQIEVPSLEEVRARGRGREGPIDRRRDRRDKKERKGERVRERKDQRNEASSVRPSVHSMPTDLINLALLFIDRHLSSIPPLPGNLVRPLPPPTTSGVRSSRTRVGTWKQASVPTRHKFGLSEKMRRFPVGGAS